MIITSVRDLLTQGSFLEGVLLIGPMAIGQAILSGAGWFIW